MLNLIFNLIMKPTGDMIFDTVLFTFGNYIMFSSMSISAVVLELLSSIKIIFDFMV